jgi:hypothetical protein
MIRFASLLVLLALVLSVSVWAEDPPRAEVFGGYQYTRLNSGVSGVGGFNLNGWDAAFDGYFTKHLGVTADFSGAYGSPFGVSVKAHTFMFGPIVRFPLSDRLTPFVHALGGGVHTSAGLGGGSASETDGVWAIGGGLDVGVKRFAIRVGQFDYLQTRIGGQTQNDFRYSAGVVFRF